MKFFRLAILLQMLVHIAKFMASGDFRSYNCYCCAAAQVSIISSVLSVLIFRQLPLVGIICWFYHNVISDRQFHVLSSPSSFPPKTRAGPTSSYSGHDFCVGDYYASVSVKTQERKVYRPIAIHDPIAYGYGGQYQGLSTGFLALRIRTRTYRRHGDRPTVIISD